MPTFTYYIFKQSFNFLDFQLQLTDGQYVMCGFGHKKNRRQCWKEKLDSKAGEKKSSAPRAPRQSTNNPFTKIPRTCSIFNEFNTQSSINQDKLDKNILIIRIIQ